MIRRCLGMGLVAMVATVVGLGCKKGADEHGHDHSEEHPAGHDHHAEGHGHGDAPVVRITKWGEHLELFSEHEAAVVGGEVSMLAHFTVLDGFTALNGAKVELELSGPAEVRAVATEPVRPGIYVIAFKPTAAGTYAGRMVVTGGVPGVETTTIDGLALEVYSSAEAAERAVGEHDDDGFIELLKEQQWKIPFSTAFAVEGVLSPSIEVAGVVATPPGGVAEIAAPIGGRVVVPKTGLPSPGQLVKKGELLATMAPAPGSPEDAVRASLAVVEAEARVQRAEAALARAERLLGDQAISQREVDDARREIAVSEEALRAAKSAKQLYAGASAGTGAGTWRLTAPIDGTVVEIHATPGAAVSAGTLLFKIVDTDELWIRARVPEQDAATLRTDRDASFQIAGLSSFLPIDVTGEDASASVVTVGRTVDPVSRTVDVIYALRTPDPRLRLGGLVRVNVPAGDDVTGVVVPRAAIIDNDGTAVVYVQADGEHFEERVIRTGARAGDRLEVVAGLAVGDRIAVTGATVVRLAGKADSGGGHGHVH